jgi:NTE family protein
VCAVGLVLGGGGITGHAFHAGVLAALDEVLGFDARSASIIVGTSAGSTAGALIRAGLRGDDLAARASGEPPSPDIAEVLERYGPPIDVSSLPKPRGLSLGRPSAPGRLLNAMRRPWGNRVGTIAGALMAEGEVPSQIVSDPIDRMFGGRWPDQPLWVCAVRLNDGTRVVFRAADAEGGAGVTVGTAVAASCAVPGWYRPVVVGDVRFVDGGLWSPTNADTLVGEALDAVIISSPMSAVPRAARRRRDGIARQFLRRYLMGEVAALRRSGVPALVIEPTAGDMAEMGSDVLDPVRRAPVTKQVRASAVARLRDGDLALRVKEMGVRWS